MFKHYKIKTINKIYDETSITQLDEMSKVFNDNNIIIMPDYHTGKGCVVGTTMKIADKVCPNHVGVDIGCGVTGYFLTKDELDLAKIKDLDVWLRNGGIPSGKRVRAKVHKKSSEFTPNSRLIKSKICTRDELALGTLGGGNHFIEIDRTNGGYWVFVHSGSRNLGLRVAKHHQQIAIEKCCLDAKLERENRRKSVIITTKKHKIQEELSKLKFSNLSNENAYLTGSALEDYLYDIEEIDNYAKLNREIIVSDILNFLGVNYHKQNLYNCSHNFIDSQNILRKGAIPAYKGDLVFIPLNMKDGIIIGRGKGNPSWNYSAPHGAGRVLSRGQAKKLLSMNKFQEDMKEIYTSSVNKNTLDECPDAYKPKDEILGIIDETVEVIEVAKPVYNFKANE